MCKKKLYVESAVIVMAVAAVMFFPVMGTAGSLEPTAAPAPTMKTLDQIPPTWSQALPVSRRYELINFQGQPGTVWAVLDKETGLVWEKSPQDVGRDWYEAMDYCYRVPAGFRSGWHLPTVEQFGSLLIALENGMGLPPGHPFNTDCSSGKCVNLDAAYWTATTYPSNSSRAYAGFVQPQGPNPKDYLKTENFPRAWCVRGGQTNDGL